MVSPTYHHPALLGPFNGDESLTNANHCIQDLRRPQKQIPLLGYHLRLRHHIPDPLHPCYQPRGFQARDDYLGMGGCNYRGAVILFWC